jgi:hypothetical protein
MSVSGSMLTPVADGGMLCAWLLGTNLLIAALMIALVFLRPEDVQDSDSVAM